MRTQRDKMLKQIEQSVANTTTNSAPSQLTPAEQRRLAQIEAALKPLKAEKAAILNRNRVRSHYQRQKASDQS